MKKLITAVLTLFCFVTYSQNLLNPVMQVLSDRGELLYEVDSRVLAGVLSSEFIDLDIGPLHIEGVKEDMSYPVTTSEGTVSRQNVMVFRSDSSVLSIFPGGDIFFYALDSLPRVFQKTDDNLYILQVDTSDRGFQCAALSHPEITPQPSDVNTLANKVVKVYFEADKALHDSKGGVTGTVNWIHSVFEVVKLLYARESIAAEISEIFVWTTQDSYSTSSSLTALQQFRSARQNANGDLRHLLALKPRGLGGIAWVNALCTSYNFAYSNIQANFSSFPNYSWTVMVITHEMGHNLGSPHTQSCAWGPGKNQALDNCYQTEGGCAPGPAPTNGGTIMSYCHLTQYGINMSNGFGTEPGNLIRSRVNSANCLSEDNGCSTPVLSVGAISQTTATITWNPTRASLYYIRYRTGNENWIEQATNQTSFGLTGLSPGTSYTVQVRSECEADYTVALNFTTQSPPVACGDFSPKTFETDIGMALSGDFQWRRRSGGTPSSNTGPTGAFQGSYYLYMEASSPNYPNKTAVATTECFSIKENQALSFSYHMFGVNIGGLSVRLNGSVIWTKQGDQGNSWQTAVIDLPVASNAVVSFHGFTGSGYRGDIAIDDVKIVGKEVTACEASPGFSTMEWIENIKVGGMIFQTGNNGGYFAGEISPPLGVQNITVTPGVLREPCSDLHTAVYSEVNGEWVLRYSGQGKVAQNGSVTLTKGKWRVIVSYEAINNACEAVKWGEIEDYTIK